MTAIAATIRIIQIAPLLLERLTVVLDVVVLPGVVSYVLFMSSV
jgi:hypothetical protein